MAKTIVLARKPRAEGPAGTETVLLDRETGLGRYVDGTATRKELADGVWHWGHYFNGLDAALIYFNGR